MLLQIKVKLMHNDLTPKQSTFLRYLKNEIKGTGREPSFKETDADLNVSQTAEAQMIPVLESKNFLRRDGRYGPSIHIVIPD